MREAAARRSLLAFGLLAAAAVACAEEPADDSLSKELALFNSKLAGGATPAEACQELEVLCQTTGFGCRAHELFCRIPTKEYICQQLAAACTRYPAACDVYNAHCGPGPVPRDGGPIQTDGGSINKDGPCIDPAICCGPEEIECRGYPDDGVVCKCRAAWDGGVTRSDGPVPPPQNDGGIPYGDAPTPPATCSAQPSDWTCINGFSQSCSIQCMQNPSWRVSCNSSSGCSCMFGTVKVAPCNVGPGVGLVDGGPMSAWDCNVCWTALATGCCSP